MKTSFIDCTIKRGFSMDYIHKLPFIISILAAITAGMICYGYNNNTQETYMKMALSMVAFYFIGLILRSTLSSLVEEVRLKQEQMEAEKKAMELDKIENEKTAKQTANGIQPSTIDLAADDNSEEFSPLKVSEYIKSVTKSGKDR